MSELYNGYWLTRAVGNNAFSFAGRHNRKIYVAPLVNGTVQDLKVGDEIAFSEVDEGREVNRPGLRSFIYFNCAGKDIFIFDNHNHAFCFWMAGLFGGRLRAGGTLLHVDQHSDMRQPELAPDPVWLRKCNLRRVFDYTNKSLNVGNFIQPALGLQLFEQVQLIDSSIAFAERITGEFVLDIDVDIFAPEMAYIDEALKVSRIQEMIGRAKFITIATSPFFIDQSRAVGIVKELLLPWQDKSAGC